MQPFIQLITHKNTQSHPPRYLEPDPRITHVTLKIALILRCLLCHYFVFNFTFLLKNPKSEIRIPKFESAQ